MPHPADIAREMTNAWSRPGALAYMAVRLTLVTSRRELTAWWVLTRAIVRA
ncbi:MAG TPA: hypothetical protein VF695_06255 [Sphingomonas sp.]|jgi:hypothetical protein